jgi:putative pyruvate formate lyase activating enzyme
VDDPGLLEIVDPGFDELPLLQAIDSGYEVRASPLSGFTTPRFLAARHVGCGVPVQHLYKSSEAQLWEIHAAVLTGVRSVLRRVDLYEATLLDLKIELARRILQHCSLCAHRCGVDRTKGARGVCRLGTTATVAENYVHIAEEGPVNPSLVLNLAGCGLRCKFCQQGLLLDPASVTGEPLEFPLWKQLDTAGARSLSFVGGNPDESLYAILKFLNGAPTDWRLPIVWNCHGAATLDTVMLLNGLVDAYVPDYKYGDEACGRRLSGIAGYPDAALAAITAMLAQHVPVIVRILVLPGHFTCCHEPVLQELASLAAEDLLVSVRGQYCPDWRITEADGDLARRPTSAEVDIVRSQARVLGLQLSE